MVFMLAHQGNEVDVVYNAYPSREVERVCLVVDTNNDLQAMIAPPLYVDSIRCF